MLVKSIVRTETGSKEIETLGIQAFICPGYFVNELEHAFKDVSAIVHLVATAKGPERKLDEVNVRVLDRVIEAAKKAGVKKIVYLSGLGVGFDDAYPAGLAPYFYSKERGEYKVKHAGIPYVIFRPSFIVGPGDGFTRAVVNAIAGGYVRLPAPEGATMQPVSIDDATDAILAAAADARIANITCDLVGPETILVDTIVMDMFQAIRDSNVKISAPVIEHVPPGKQDPSIDESFEFLACTVKGNPSTVIDKLHVQVAPVGGTIAAAVRDILKPDEPVPEKRAIMLFSGGLDSVTTLYWMRSQGYDVIPLSMHYHNRPTREVKAAEHICQALGIKAIDVPVPYIMEVLELKLAGYPVPSLFGSSDYYVPYRNLVFNTIATYFADIYGARYIISGHISSDPLPDANQAFFDSLEQLVSRLKVGEKAIAPKFLLPLKGKTKADAVKLGKSLGVPFEWTWSCAFDAAAPCGHCKPCRERAEGFKAAGIVDPVIAFRLPAP